MHKHSGMDLKIPNEMGKLQARLTRPGDPPASARWVVLSHPHPQYGGSMDNKIITTLARVFQQAGWGTLAYNFRGVGGSEGDYDEGIGEQYDLQAVVQWLRDNQTVDQLMLAGFSFGSYVSIAQAEALQVDALCTVAPPVNFYAMASMHPQCEWLLIQGGQDEVVPPEAVMQWALSRDQVPDVIWRQQAGHFFHRQLIWLKQMVTAHFHPSHRRV